MKQPIAMRCTKKQFKSVKNKLKKTEDIESFKHNPYLVTNLCNIDGLVSNVDKKRSRDYNRKIYEEWNEKIFLEALGIETEGAKDIILEKVKEYFKNAKTVRCLHNLKEASIVDNITSEIYGDNKDFWINSSTHDGEGILLYDNGKFAEILTYKEKTFSITESQIKMILSHCGVYGETERLLKEYIPEAFESEVKLEKKDLVSGWMKHKNGAFKKWLWYVNFETGENYGFGANGEWSDYGESQKEYVKGRCENVEEQEVLESLKNEAKKRYKKFDYINGFYHNKISILSFNDTGCENQGVYYVDKYFCVWMNCVNGRNEKVFEKGKWAEIIPTITLSEAEQQLRKKIIV